MREEPQIVVDKPELVVAHYQQICIAIPRGDPDTAMIENIRGGMTALARRAGGSVGLLFIVAAKSSAPTGRTREAAAEMFDELRPNLKAVSAHMEGSGFAAAAKRSVFTWATQRMLGKTPVKTFGRLADSTHWLELKCKELKLNCPTSLELQSFVSRIHESTE